MELVKRSENRDSAPWLLCLSERRLLRPEVREEAAQIIASDLKKCIGDRNRKDPWAWCNAADEKGIDCRGYADIHAEPGLYAPSAYFDTRAIIAVNIALTDGEQVAAWIHELAHHALHCWVPPQLENAADLRTYDDEDIEEARHKIAQRVEELILS